MIGADSPGRSTCGFIRAYAGEVDLDPEAAQDRLTLTTSGRRLVGADRCTQSRLRATYRTRNTAMRRAGHWERL